MANFWKLHEIAKWDIGHDDTVVDDEEDDVYL